MSALTTILLITFFIILAGFFSGSETAFISLNRLKLRSQAQKNDRKALLILKMLENPDRLLGTTLVGTNISVICASIVLTTFLFTKFSLRNETLVTFILTPVILIFGEMIPKAVFRQKADRLGVNLIFVLKFFSLILFPIVTIVTSFSKLILKIGKKAENRKNLSLFVTRDELKYLIRESEKEGIVEPHERSIIYHIFDFGAKRLKDVMIPLEQIKSVDLGMSISEFKELARKCFFSRFPVYDEARNFFIGLIYILDVLHEEEKAVSLRNFLRPILFFNEEDLIDGALFKLQSEKQHMAIVLDVNHRPAGLVTIKDLLDELAGETI